MIKLDRLRKIHILVFKIKIYLISLKMQVLVEVVVDILEIWEDFNPYFKIYSVGLEVKKDREIEEIINTNIDKI
jgi:hypothetical protein